MTRFGYAVAFAALLSQPSIGIAADGKVLERVRACITETDDTRRLACYDAALGVANDAESSAALNAASDPPMPQDVPVPAESTHAADARSAVERFGYRGEIAREEADKIPELEMLQARITAIEWLPRGEFVLTLDNGQVWRQKTKQSIGSLEIGDEVTIRAGALGSFRLSGSSNRSTLVQRVQ